MSYYLYHQNDSFIVIDSFLSCFPSKLISLMLLLLKLNCQPTAIFHSLLSLNVRIHEGQNADVSALRSRAGCRPTGLLKLFGRHHASLFGHLLSCSLAIHRVHWSSSFSFQLRYLWHHFVVKVHRGQRDRGVKVQAFSYLLFIVWQELLLLVFR